MGVRPGYKQTEVGDIPEDWQVMRLGDFSTISAGGTPSRANRMYWNGNIPWVTTSEINFCIINRVEQSITMKGLVNSASKIFSRGTILMALYGQGKTRGKVGIIGVENAATNQACAAISLNSGVLAEYIFYFLSNKYESIRKLSNTGNQENLNGSIVRSISVLLPPLEEQRTITDALTDVDGLLAALDRLIAKKRDLKQAAMQQLLTGQTRLTGFHGEWEIKRLGDVAPLQRGFDLPNQKLRSGPHPVVYSNGVLNHHAEFQVKGPGVVTGRSGTIGKVTFVENDFWPHNTSLWVTSFKGNDPKFIYYIYSRIGFDRFSTGSGVPTLNRNDVHLHQISIPTGRTEQTAIAEVLSDMDAELAALAQRREKTRLLKQAMMQELLTGRTRLVPPGGRE